tara:strand:- start:406 stop:852 length:447 start_codon:yes stop_codon:yes gene_type:complete
MNKDKIFELFDDDIKSGEDVNVSQSDIISIMKQPYTKIGMFTKLIINHHVFYEKLKKFFKKEGAEFNIDKAKEASQFTVYNRAWSYIKQIKIEDKDHIQAIGEFEPPIFIKALQDSILYFEDREEYEKCAHLLKIKEVVNTFENPLGI